MKRIGAMITVLWVLASGVSCMRMKHDMTIQPVHITVEIRVKIDRALGEFFGAIDEKQYKETTESKEPDGGKSNEK